MPRVFPEVPGQIEPMANQESPEAAAVQVETGAVGQLETMAAMVVMAPLGHRA
jgi:hypothetical protein